MKSSSQAQVLHAMCFCLCLYFFSHRETVEPNGSYENTLSITPMLSENKEKRGLALDGRLKDEDTNLASTTM